MNIREYLNTAGPGWYSFIHFNNPGDHVGKHKRIIKIHDLLKHGLGLRARRLHGAGVGTESMEGLFAVFRRVSSNCRNAGVQVMQRLACEMDAQRNALGNGVEAQAIRDIADDDDESGQQKAGTVTADAIPAAAQILQLLEENEKGGSFVKWIHLATESVAGSCRGVQKLYAAPSWHGGEQFDFILQGDSVYLLRALYKKVDGTVIAFGWHLPYIFDRFHLPIHCIVPDARMERIAGSVTATIVLQAWPWYGPVSGERREALLQHCSNRFQLMIPTHITCLR